MLAGCWKRSTISCTQAASDEAAAGAVDAGTGGEPPDDDDDDVGWAVGGGGRGTAGAGRAGGVLRLVASRGLRHPWTVGPCVFSSLAG